MIKKIIIFLLFPFILSAQLVPENYIWGDTVPNLVLMTNHDGEAEWKHPDSLGITGSGETNTMSNVNTLGYGVYKQKTGLNFEMRGVNTTGSILSNSLDGNNNINIALDDNLNLYDNSISNFSVGSHAVISDAAYSGAWNGNTTAGASKNSIYDKINLMKEGLWFENGVDIYYDLGWVSVGRSIPSRQLESYVSSSSGQIPFTVYNAGSGNTHMEIRNSQNSYSIGVHTNDYEIYDNGFGRVFRILDNGDVELSRYSNNDDYTGIHLPDNVMYVDASGKIMIKPEPISMTVMQQTNATQEWNNSTWTTLDLESQVIDYGDATTGSTATDRININRTGVYEIKCMLQGTSTGTDVAVDVDIFIGGSAMGRGQTLYISGANSINKGSISIEFERRITSGSYIQVKMKRLGSNATSIKSAGNHNPSFSVTRKRITN